MSDPRGAELSEVDGGQNTSGADDNNLHLYLVAVVCITGFIFNLIFPVSHPIMCVVQSTGLEPTLISMARSLLQ